MYPLQIFHRGNVVNLKRGVFWDSYSQFPDDPIRIKGGPVHYVNTQTY